MDLLRQVRTRRRLRATSQVAANCLFNACADCGKFTHLFSVCGTLGERTSEDGGVGGHTDDIVGLDEFGEVAAGQTLKERSSSQMDASVGRLLSGLRHVKTFDLFVQK